MEALYADALLFAGRYAEVAEQFARCPRTDLGAHGAAWRLKLACLPFVRRHGGDRQRRDRDRAEQLIEPVDLEQPGISTDEALGRLGQALAADACAGEAWFRLAAVSAVHQQDLRAQAPVFLTAAVLLRYATGAWMNAAVCALDTASDDALVDRLQVAYQANGEAFVAEAVNSADRFEDRGPRSTC